MRRAVFAAGLAAAFGLGALVAVLTPVYPGTELAGAPGRPESAPGSEPTRSPASPSMASPPSAAATMAPRPPSAPSTEPPSILDRTGVQERLQAALEAGRAELAAPGVAASVLLADGRQWTGTAGVADLASGRPLSATTPFAVASISKTFLAAEILALVEAGTLTLDAPVASLLPGMRVSSRPIDPRITVRQLLDHTSGLRDYLVDPRFDRAVLAEPSRPWTLTRALAYAGRPVAPPGVRYFYANTNYALLGLLAERVTGRTLAAEYRSRFFEPLSLRSAFYQGVETPTAEVPTAYRYTSGALDAVPIDITDGTAIRPFTAITTAAGPAGSIAASPADLVRWAMALYAGPVLQPASVLAMLNDATLTAALKPRVAYGFGVQRVTINGQLSYGHSGRLVGAQSVVRWFPDAGVAIAVTTNESRFDPTIILRDLLAIVSPQSIGGGHRPV